MYILIYRQTELTIEQNVSLYSEEDDAEGAFLKTIDAWINWLECAADDMLGGSIEFKDIENCEKEDGLIRHTCLYDCAGNLNAEMYLYKK